MHYLNETNLVICGWNSTGSTITALMLAYLLSKKFIYAGGTYKFIAEELGYDSKSGGLVEYEKKYGEKWDILCENYFSWKIKNEKNLLVNSKITGFFLEDSPSLFSAFIISSLETRAHRAGKDDRTEDISHRDEELVDRWMRLFNVNYMDLAQIRKHYDYIIENDELTIAETAFEIYKVMREALGLRERLLLSDLQKLEKIAHTNGKDFFYQKLKEKDLLIKTSEIFSDWIEYFDEELEDTAEEWKAVVYKYAK